MYEMNEVDRWVTLSKTDFTPPEAYEFLSAVVEEQK